MTSAFEFPKCSPVLFVFSLVFDAKNKCIGDDTNAAARQILNCIKNKKNVACCSGIVTVNSPSGSTLQCDMWLWNDMPLNLHKRPPYWILHLVSILTTSPQSTCHSAPVSEILSKSDHPRPKKMTSCRFSRWWISAILDFMGAIMGSLKSPGTTSYRSSIETIALNCLAYEKIAFFYILATDRQTTHRQIDEQMDSTDELNRSRCRERRLNKQLSCCGKAARAPCRWYCVVTQDHSRSLESGTIR